MPVHAVPFQIFQHLDQREVGFGQCLKQPIFFQKFRMLWMAHERKMGVKDESKMSQAHERVLDRPTYHPDGLPARNTVVLF